MFNKKDYQDTFSQVTASEETYRRVMRMSNRKSKKGGRTLSRIVLIAAIVALLAVTASAAGYVRSWFTTYFSDKNIEPLTTEQITYFEENEQIFSQSVTCDGYTMELKSAITDGEKAYICIGVTAPEDVLLNATDIEGYSTNKPTLMPDNFQQGFLTNQNGNEFFGYSSIASKEDYDGLGNTQDLVIELTSDPEVLDEDAFGTNMVWTLRFENLTAKYMNEAYMNELIDGKYKGQENFFFTDEESEGLYPEVTLAEGVWEFEIKFDNPDTFEVELIDTPVASQTSAGYRENGENVYVDVNITSFVLRSLSASLYTDDQTFAPDLTGTSEIYAVMKDGSKVQLISEGGAPGEQQFRAEAPILLENVDHVLLADGTKLPMPE